MAWFRRPLHTRVSSPRKKDIPDGLWTKCPECGEYIYNKDLASNLKLCPQCDFHFSLAAHERVQLLLDEGTFEEWDGNLRSTDPLEFEDSKKYIDRLREAVNKTGLGEAALTGCGNLVGRRIGFGVLDFGFLGGSMASVVGERLCRLIERATEEGIPLVVVASSGGARMQEGILSLMQMVKTSAAIGLLGRRRLPYVSVMVNPTTGGVTASFASLGDVIMAEPKALIGFAGPRVIQQTIRQELPEGFQRAEFLVEHGMVDMVVRRPELKPAIARVLSLLSGEVHSAAPAA